MSDSRRLDDAATAMVTADAEQRLVVPVLTRLCPEIREQIETDAKTPGLLSFWGRCVNVDEHADATIVHPAILHAIGELAGVPMEGRIVHAGLQHTYGYLFSQIETPYGSKRDRWVTPSVTRGFGLDRSLLRCDPKEGTLLANLTWFVGQIVYRPDPYYLARLERLRPHVAAGIVEYDYDALQVCRITDQVLLGKQEREVLLVTDLVTFPVVPPDRKADKFLLAYSVQNGATAALKMITAFPVPSKVVRELVMSVPAKRRARIRTHYNAYVPGLLGRTVRGRRFCSRRTLRIE